MLSFECLKQSGAIERLERFDSPFVVPRQTYKGNETNENAKVKSNPVQKGSHPLFVFPGFFIVLLEARLPIAL